MARFAFEKTPLDRGWRKKGGGCYNSLLFRAAARPRGAAMGVDLSPI